MIEILKQDPIIVTCLLVTLVLAWFILLMQALLHEAKVAIIGIFASALLMFNMSMSGVAAVYLFWLALSIKLLFIILFGRKHYRKPYFYLPVLVMSAVLLFAFIVTAISVE
ncbi:hypothetical protein KO507_02715 [Gilvimarinus agarilyticus]|uniref:hypothetical protein n=1 Tax=Gilvimarinus sp. 2_MG-2023 TaxID=3062666 RepID=UPI001C0812CE|nr:hypothetical protein [Gilvimarinus sp. 2_MG-2023]MBU2884671.1 hypothetical protein [Gilvimarinus agarilyticus]MDO6569779.1 hypothetical protein [Gilvimarinus sp. 2_MG-2023]